MSVYKVADGHDIASGSLNTLSPQPRSRGFQATRRTHAANGDVGEEAFYIELVWDYVDDATAYASILTAFGLGAATATNEVTVLIPDNTYGWTRYNGKAVRPEIGRDVAREQFYIRNVVILVKELVAAS